MLQKVVPEKNYDKGLFTYSVLDPCYIITTLKDYRFDNNGWWEYSESLTYVIDDRFQQQSMLWKSKENINCKGIKQPPENWEWQKNNIPNLFPRLYFEY